MTATTTAQMLKMSDADYFAHDALNHSSLRWLIEDTPAHFRYRMDNPQHEPTYRRCRACHIADRQPPRAEGALPT